MNDDDIHQIERALEVTLPEEYARLLRDDPFSGGVEEFYGEVDRIIGHNMFMRHEGYVRPWSMNWLIIGDDNAGDDYILDLNLNPSPVFFLDHELYTDRENLDRAIKEIAPNLAAYVDQVNDQIREWLEDDGYLVADDPARVLRRLRHLLDDANPPSIDDTLAEVLDLMAGAEGGTRRVGVIGLLPKEIAAISDLWFQVFGGVCRITRLTDDGGIDVWLWRDDRATEAGTVVLAGDTVDAETAHAAVLDRLPSLPADLLQRERA